MMMRHLTVVIMKMCPHHQLVIVARRRGVGDPMSPHQLNMTSISVADVMLEIWKRLAPIVCVKSLEAIL